MSQGAGWWRRMSVALMRHAGWLLPDNGSPWAEAMRHELDYIADDQAAFRWALGCVMTGYRFRLSEVRHWRARTALQHIAACAVAVLAIGLALQQNAKGQPEPPRAAFVETPCDLPALSPAVRPRLRCGTVSVPRNYADPGAGQFKLAVVVVKSATQPAQRDPVVYISGGPGGPLTIYAAHQAETPYAPDRDLILVDQRGIGRSEPSLCPALNGALLEANGVYIAAPTADTRRRLQTVYAACRDTEIKHGIDPRDFGTRTTVEDYQQVRRALGVQQWNLYGESYGTTVAMTLLALHPEHVRSVVLDSVYPQEPMPPHSALAARARDALFGYCAHDAACAAAFPELADIYRAALERLRQTPLSVAVPPRLHQPGDRMQLTARLFEVVIDNLVYYPTAYPTLPLVISAARDGDDRAPGTAIAREMDAATQLNWGANAAVECRDRVDLHRPVPDDTDALDLRHLAPVCDRWSELGPPPLIPAGTDVPTLILTGQFDPVAGPAVSRDIARQLGGKAQVVEFALVGHNVRAFSQCGAQIAANFIDKPARPLDVTCADHAAPIRFLPPRPAR